VQNQGRGRPVNSAVFFQTLDKKMTAELIEPLFREKFADFYLALQIPRSPAEKETPEEAKQCGRYIVDEIARNSSDVLTLLRGLRKWEPAGSISLSNPVEVAEKEHRTGNRAEIHFVSYHAIETLMSKSTPSCFAGVDLAAVREYLSSVKDRAQTS